MFEILKNWFRLAMSGPVVRRALMFAVVVGAVLNLINHSGCCVQTGCFSTECIQKMLLTATVPYLVSTISSVQAMLTST